MNSCPLCLRPHSTGDHWFCEWLLETPEKKGYMNSPPLQQKGVPFSYSNTHLPLAPLLGADIEVESSIKGELYRKFRKKNPPPDNGG